MRELKRARNTSKSRAPGSKKTVPKCSAYGKRGHNLPECWLIFEELKPEKVKLSAHQVRNAKKTVSNNEQLRSQVEEIQEKMAKEAAAKKAATKKTAIKGRK
jgi:hypothetical protein